MFSGRSEVGRDTENNQNALKSVRSGGFVDTILNKIESHSKWYERIDDIVSLLLLVASSIVNLV